MVAVRNESQVILIFYDNDVQMRLSSSRTPTNDGREETPAASNHITKIFSLSLKTLGLLTIELIWFSDLSTDPA